MTSIGYNMLADYTLWRTFRAVVCFLSIKFHSLAMNQWSQCFSSTIKDIIDISNQSIYWGKRWKPGLLELTGCYKVWYCLDIQQSTSPLFMFTYVKSFLVMKTHAKTFDCTIFYQSPLCRNVRKDISASVSNRMQRRNWWIYLSLPAVRVWETINQSSGTLQSAALCLQSIEQNISGVYRLIST